MRRALAPLWLPAGRGAAPEPGRDHLDCGRLIFASCSGETSLMEGRAREGPGEPLEPSAEHEELRLTAADASASVEVSGVGLATVYRVGGYLVSEGE